MNEKTSEALKKERRDNSKITARDWVLLLGILGAAGLYQNVKYLQEIFSRL